MRYTSARSSSCSELRARAPARRAGPPRRPPTPARRRPRRRWRRPAGASTPRGRSPRAPVLRGEEHVAGEVAVHQLRPRGHRAGGGEQSVDVRTAVRRRLAHPTRRGRHAPSGRHGRRASPAAASRRSAACSRSPAAAISGQRPGSCRPQHARPRTSRPRPGRRRRPGAVGARRTPSWSEPPQHPGLPGELRRRAVERLEHHVARGPRRCPGRRRAARPRRPGRTRRAPPAAGRAARAGSSPKTAEARAGRAPAISRSGVRGGRGRSRSRLWVPSLADPPCIGTTAARLESPGPAAPPSGGGRTGRARALPPPGS